MTTKLRTLNALKGRLLTPLPQSHNRTEDEDVTRSKSVSPKKLKPLRSPSHCAAYYSLSPQSDSSDSGDSEEFDVVWNRRAERSKFLLTPRCADEEQRRHSERPNLTSSYQKRLETRELPKLSLQRRRESCPVEVFIAFSPSQSAKIAHRNRLGAIGTETLEEHDIRKVESPSKALWKKSLKAKLRTKESIDFLRCESPKLRTHTKKIKPSYSLQLSRALQPVDVRKFFTDV
mmetsp:Transcript_57706/g.65856  ORF Transcript_57706/g.65856 Transcript_57706/m.65856 type:complete len:232 (+) Transcript_57706:79-774(+)